jgi:hypothetical protein
MLGASTARYGTPPRHATGKHASHTCRHDVRVDHRQCQARLICKPIFGGSGVLYLDGRVVREALDVGVAFAAPHAEHSSAVPAMVPPNKQGEEAALCGAEIHVTCLLLVTRTRCGTTHRRKQQGRKTTHTAHCVHCLASLSGCHGGRKTISSVACSPAAPAQSRSIAMTREPMPRRIETDY